MPNGSVVVVSGSSNNVPMVTVQLAIGLGNEMFQYAMGRAVAVRHDTELALDLHVCHHSDASYKQSYQLGALNILERIVPTRYFLQRMKSKLAFLEAHKPLVRRTYVKEELLRSGDNFLTISGDVYLEGSWQDVKYFDGIENLLRQEFTLKEPFDTDTDIFRVINRENTIAIHVRRRDYVWCAGDALLSLDYFKKAMEVVTQKLQNPSFIIFSDEIDWVKENLEIPGEHHFVEPSCGFEDHEELILMSMCKHQIISNSTFSWWAAYLNPHPGKIVIAPALWNGSAPFDSKTLLLPSWIAL